MQQDTRARIKAVAATVATAYRTVAIIGLTTLLLLSGINALLARAFEARDAMPGPIREYGMETMRVPGVYEGLDEDAIWKLLDETWSRPMAYEAYTMFREGPYRSDSLNVDEHGFRWVANQATFPPAEERFTVFVFGGSTTFGYGVPDEQTIPSHLQAWWRETTKRADVDVFNFGRGYYKGAQERVFFEELLARGHVPDMAIFIDGANDTTDAPSLEERFEAVFEPSSASRKLGQAVDELALTRFAKGLLTRAAPTEGGGVTDCADAKIPEPWQGQPRWFANKRLLESVCQGAGVACLFVWQPVPFVHYDLSKHPFNKNIARNTEHLCVFAHMYEAVEAHVAAQKPDNLLYLGRMQTDLDGVLYVDAVHYNDRMNRLLAERIGNKAVEMTSTARP